MIERLKILLPIAGFGTRLRPHTLFRPKPLVPLAGKTVLDHVLDKFSTLPPGLETEYIFVIGAMGEQIKEHMDRVYPGLKTSYFVQQQMRGQSDAIYSAREQLSGPVLISFGDTITNPDFSDLGRYQNDGVIWVKPVSDVSQMGVIQTRPDGSVAQLFEKPKEYVSNQALVGIYYFSEGRDLADALEEQFQRGKTLKNEFYLADAINIMIENGACIQPETVTLWLDAGAVEPLLGTNAYLLAHGHARVPAHLQNRADVRLIPPVFIHESASICNSVIGPNVMVEKDCVLDRVIVHDAILQQGTALRDMLVADSIVGRNQHLAGRAFRISG